MIIPHFHYFLGKVGLTNDRYKVGLTQIEYFVYQIIRDRGKNN